MQGPLQGLRTKEFLPAGANPIQGGKRKRHFGAS